MKTFPLTLLALVAFLLLSMRAALAASPDPIVVWHAYRDDEERALKEVARLYEERSGQHIELLSVPFDAYRSKLQSAIPSGDGPDMFIDAHERVGSYVREHLVAAVGDALGPADLADLDEGAIAAVSVNGKAFGIPLSDKCLALYLNTDLLPEPPSTIESFVDIAKKLPPGVIALGYNTMEAFYHAPFLHAFGGRFVDDSDDYTFYGPRAVQSVEFVKGLAQRGVLPDEPSDALVKQLFLNGKIAAVINGPWFATELRAGGLAKGLNVRVVPLPRIEAAKGPDQSGEMRPFLTVEALYLTPSGATRAAARGFARFVSGPESSRVRALIGRQIVVRQSVWHDPALAGDPQLRAFREASRTAILMRSSPAMSAMWVPAKEAILKVLRGDMEAAPALLEGRHRWDDVMRPPPARRSPMLLLIVCGVLFSFAAMHMVRRARDDAFRKELRASWPAYRYVVHAVLAVGVLVLLPLAFGAVTSLFTGLRDAPHYVGFANYISILTARGQDLLGHGSFYLTLLVTILWTVCNVVCHVTLGLILGAALSRPWLKVRAVYRVLLILPWAVPSYVTALAWKGMFHRQFGAINALLRAVGLEPISWFSHFSTAFAANLLTNVWLGFPFMMVVTMGALTSIPRDVLEAADVDGATRWQRFRLVTLPLLRPALLPSVVLGAVWTFNMFNVVYLVSGGEPDSTTDILVSDAYRWAFTRDAQYGYAAAYAVIIFGLLSLGSRVVGRTLGRDGVAA